MKMISFLRSRSVQIACVGLVAAGLVGACGGAATEYPNRMIGANGEEIVLDDIEAIIDDDELTDDQKREELRSLGIGDELLIDALLTL